MMYSGNKASVGTPGGIAPRGDVSPRKSMGMGSGPRAEASMFPGKGAKAHPDRSMNSGRDMGDGERGIGMPVSGMKGGLPAQSAPDHGPHYEGSKGFSRGGKA